MTNTEVEFIVNNDAYTGKTDDNGKDVFDADLLPGQYTVYIVHQANLEKTEVILTILSVEDKPTNPTHQSTMKVTKQVYKATYKILSMNIWLAKQGIQKLETRN